MNYIQLDPYGKPMVRAVVHPLDAWSVLLGAIIGVLIGMMVASI